jgi:hypothetical protein
MMMMKNLNQKQKILCNMQLQGRYPLEARAEAEARDLQRTHHPAMTHQWRLL